MISKKTKNNGFSLTEIIVVVTIIALLASFATTGVKKILASSQFSRYLADRKVIAQAINAHRLRTGSNITDYQTSPTRIDPLLLPYLPPEFHGEKPKTPFGDETYWITSPSSAEAVLGSSSNVPVETTSAYIGVVYGDNLSDQRKLLIQEAVANLKEKQTVIWNNSILYFL